MQSGPAQNAVRSSTRSPSNGQRPSAAGRGSARSRSARRRCAGRRARRGGGRVRAGAAAAGRTGTGGRARRSRRAGWRRSTRARGSGRSRGIVAPLPIGAWGMRNVPARSSTSAVVRSAIHAAIAGCRWARLAKSERSSIHSGWPTITQKSSHCWPVPTPTPTRPSLVDSTPGRRSTTRPLAERPADHVGERHRVVGEAQRQRLEHRHVDELAAAVDATNAARDTIVPIAA